MYVERVPNRNSPPAILLRESYREGKRTIKRTLANLSHWPQAQIEALRAVLRGDPVHSAPDAFEVIGSQPHGHIAAVLGTARQLEIPRLISRSPCRERDIILALICERIVSPRSKLATARMLHAETATSTLGKILDVDSIDEDEVYTAMDWLIERQARIEQALARRHLKDGTLVLYDLTSTWFEGRTCPLARYGHSRDGKKSKLQIVIGLLCEREGRPVAVEVFDGKTADPSTLASQIDKIRHRFGIERVVWVGDRGLITAARIEQELKTVEGMDWITALRAPQIRTLVNSGALQLSLFDQRDLAEIRSQDYPGERLIACRNPLLAEDRARTRNELLAATEHALEEIVRATQRQRQPLRGKEKIAMRVGKVINRYKVGKHFELDIAEDSFCYRRNEPSITQEAALDGLYVIRTSVPATVLDAEQSVRAYKGLSAVERAFRSTKTVDLKVRPIHHRLESRVRSHVLVCMLAYYVEWHMRQKLAPLLFDDHDRAAGQKLRRSIVAPAKRSPKAERKAACKRTDDGLPVHSFQTLLADLATVVCNTCRPDIPGAQTFEKLTLPNPHQQRALDLLGVSLRL